MPPPPPIFVLLTPEEVLRAVSHSVCAQRGINLEVVEAKMLIVHDDGGNAVQYRLELTAREPV